MTGSSFATGEARTFAARGDDARSAIDPPAIVDALRHASNTRTNGVSNSWAFIARLTWMRIMVGMWLIAALLDLVISVAGGGTLATPLRVAVTYGCGFAISYAIHRTLARAPMSVSDVSLLKMIAVAFPSGAALFLIDVFGRAVAHGQSPLAVWPTDFLLRTRINWAYFTMLFAFQSTIFWLTTSAQALEQREGQLLEAQLSALRLQLNPHFLFNTLSAIMTLVGEGRATEAEQMLVRLSDFLEGSLSGSPAVLVPLAAEMDMVQAYLDIEAVRFGDRLSVSYACDAGLTETQVPNFILQPLVENAMKYAVGPSKTNVAVSIRAATSGDQLVLTVADDGESLPAADGTPGTGLGLRNVAARLETLYGASAGISARRSEQGFIAEVRLPLTWIAE